MSISIEQYHLARVEIESRFFGLPHAHFTLISRLLSRANPCTGIIDNLTYNDLADLLTVTAAPGRKDSGRPTKSTVRSMLRTIEAACEKDFKIISEGQKLMIQIRALPAIYAKHGLIEEEITDQLLAVNLPDPLDKFSKIHEAGHEQIPDQTTGQITEVSTALSLVKNITKTNLNKQQTNITGDVYSPIAKQLIRDDFYPSQETVLRAQSYGLSKVTDPTEIKKFINYNQKHQCRWQDFNPIFIKWLEREQAKSVRPQVTRKNHERYSPKVSSYELTMQAVLAANSNARGPAGVTPMREEKLFSHRQHSMAMGANDVDLWAVVVTSRAKFFT